MLYTIVDIETTGLLRFDDNSVLIPDLLEFSYLQVDKDTLDIGKAGTLYFYKDWFDIESEAQQYHGITREFLMKYADQFDDNLTALKAIMTNAIIVGKNSEKFDIPFIRRWIQKMSKQQTDYDIGAITTAVGVKAYDGKSIVYHESEIQSIDVQELYAPIYRVKTLLHSLGKLNEMYDGSMTASKFEMYHEQSDKRKRGKLEEYIQMMPNGQQYVDDIYKDLPKDRVTGAHGALYDCVMTYVALLDYYIFFGGLT